MSTRRLAALGTALTAWAVAASALAAAAAGAGWRGVEELGQAGAAGPPPAIAANARGDVVVAWVSATGVDVAVARRGGAFAPAGTVPDSGGASDVRAGVNEKGKAAVVWLGDAGSGRSRVHVAGLNVDRGFGRSRPVTYAADIRLGSAAVGPGGRVAVSFAFPDGSTLTRASNPRGHFSHIVGPPTYDALGFAVSYERTQPQLVYGRTSERYTKLYVHPISRSASARSRLVASGLPPDPRIHVASASNGTQAAVWAPAGGDAAANVFAAVRRPGEPFRGRAVQRRVPPAELRAAVAPSGAALVGWPEPDGVTTSYRAPGGQFQRARSQRPVSKDVAFASLRLIVDPRGRAALAWKAARSGGSSTRLVAAQQLRGGSLHAIRALTTYGEAAELGDLAIDARGRPTLDWRNGDQIFGLRGRVAP